MYISGAKFTASSRGMRIIERTGTSLMLESADMEQRLTQETQKLLEYVKQVGTLTTSEKQLTVFALIMALRLSFQKKTS